MPTVPRVSQASIAPVQAGVPQTQAFNVQPALNSVASAIGGAGDQLASIAQREQDKADAAQANQARIDLANQEASLFDPNNTNGVYSYKGANALQAIGSVNQHLDTFYQDYRNKLPSAKQQLQFDQLFANHLLQVMDRTNKYALTENNDYQKQAYEGAVGSALSSATTKATDGDINGANLAAADGVRSIKQYATAQGWPDEYTTATIDKFNKSVLVATDAAYKANTEAYIAQNPQQALNDLSARLGIGRYSSANAGLQQDASLPRGIRNNNPGNIRTSDIQWQGKVDSPDTQYEAFSTPEAGIRATALNAVTKANRGTNTVQSLISEWAPPNENNTQAYITAVSAAMGVSPTDKLNLNNPAQLTSLTNAIITHENGSNPYSQAQIATGVNAALGQGKIPDTHPPVSMAGGGLVVPNAPASGEVGQLGKSGNFTVDQLKTADVVQLYNRAREEVNKVQVENRAVIQQRVNDDTATFRTGQEVSNPLTQGDFTRAYGDVQGMYRYGAYQADQQFAAAYQKVNTLPVSQQADFLAANQPTAGEENFAVKQSNYDALTKAIETVNQRRNTDPMGWARTANMAGVQDLDMSSPQALASSIANRVGAANTLSQTYLTPYALLSKNENAALSAAVGGMSSRNKASFLGSLSTSMDPANYRLVVSDLQKDSPTTAIAGQIMGAGRAATIQPDGVFHSAVSMDAPTISQTMLDGEALLHPSKADKDENGATKFAMPPDGGATGLRATWGALIGDAFRGNPETEVQTYQAYRAMYAGLAAKKGISDGTYDDGIAQQAARAAIGNIGTWNGHQVIPPYGMDYNHFQDAAQAQWEKIKDNVPGASGNDVWGYNIDPAGDNVYFLSNGTSPLKDKQGRPVTIHIDPDFKPAPKGPGFLSRVGAKAGSAANAVQGAVQNIPLVNSGYTDE
ncbi:hypothetical protein FHW84_002479 [Dyella sp. SG562]|uniref:hypothetical protein n=1 Tax=Dyella sp. SG562 TaxID=2587017 RepID=UPI001420B31D|nr:hypothetical protein [Dyella sp. SG562]NII73906.1 hypothetical protein [Dyella sp. SG562]